jgi:xylulokinase
MDPAARAAFLGLTAAHDRRHLIRAAVEGVTFACADAFAILGEVAPAPERVLLAGGGARSPFWRQMVADVLGIGVERLLVNEQSATGAALLAGQAAGLHDAAEAAAQWARSGDPSLPDGAAHARYDRRLELYREAWQSNRDLFHHLAGAEAPA